jgi:F-type H+-transporting ATPase subunit a
MLRNRVVQIILGVLLLGIVLRVFGIGMTRADLHISAAAEPLACIGGAIVEEHCSAGTLLPITNGLIMTVLIDLLLVLMIIFGVRNMQLVPRGLQNTVEVVVEGLYNFAMGIDRKNVAKFFPLPATIFIFFLVANMVALVPGVGSIGGCIPKAHETEQTTGATTGTTGGDHGTTTDHGATPGGAPTSADTKIQPSRFAGLPFYCADGVVVPFLRAPAADLNVTLAFALVAWVMIQVFGFQGNGIGYLSRFFNFREGFMGIFVGLIELISEFSRIISFAFRIYGNIFGGEVILAVMSYLLALVLPLPFYGFEVFVAVMQALIFAVLTLIFMQGASQAHGGHDEHEHEHDEKPVEAADLPRAVGGTH